MISTNSHALNSPIANERIGASSIDVSTTTLPAISRNTTISSCGRCGNAYNETERRTFVPEYAREAGDYAMCTSCVRDRIRVAVQSEMLRAVRGEPMPTNARVTRWGAATMMLEDARDAHDAPACGVCDVAIADQEERHLVCRVCDQPTCPTDFNIDSEMCDACV